MYFVDRIATFHSHFDSSSFGSPELFSLLDCLCNSWQYKDFGATKPHFNINCLLSRSFPFCKSYT
eukprot:TRINITY_DN5460_c0_g1_i1.p2 TRINITY_DN5460_c0_g1~~TRINITY_DN5460_c0_g1_i1.p2  ORF type:complete len:65 (+),score=8.08 TRINITY_DN5460_c0_g1_i1:90-284(+)